MEYEFVLLKQTRRLLTQFVAGLSEAQLVKIPQGFRNNILWNVGHILVTQQQMCYGLSGQPLLFDDDLVEQFRKGSNPADWQTTPSFDRIKNAILSSAEQFILDYREKKFTNFSVYESAYGMKITTIDEAVKLNNVHEAVHLGYVLAMRKFVS